MLRDQFIACETIDEAWKIAPWAAVITEVEGGYHAYESIEDYQRARMKQV